MTILARYQDILCEVVEEPFAQGGINLVCVKAVEGEPFADGARTTTKTAYKTVKAADLQPVQQESPTLLNMALQFKNKPTWAAGESIWLWGSKQRGAFLKANSNGFVELCLVGVRKACPVFELSDRGSWQPVRNVGERYQSWRREVGK